MMKRRFSPKPFSDAHPIRLPFIWDDEDGEPDPEASYPFGLSVYEEGDRVVFEAALPGVPPDDIEVNYDQKAICIQGEKKEIDKGRKFYRRASSSFSYRTALPSTVDLAKEPEASFVDGIVKMIFQKRQK